MEKCLFGVLIDILGVSKHVVVLIFFIISALPISSLLHLAQGWTEPA